ncbi:hypothetical protein VNO77_43968 [Canavalia gladiata]|uniref:Uncharacterized protein n=1 Tax=Canavalia gladiata TaxID=3824 RepID=A0AAN9PPY0_CANGL
MKFSRGNMGIVLAGACWEFMKFSRGSIGIQHSRDLLGIYEILQGQYGYCTGRGMLGIYEILQGHCSNSWNLDILSDPLSKRRHSESPPLSENLRSDYGLHGLMQGKRGLSVAPSLTPLQSYLIMGIYDFWRGDAVSSLTADLGDLTLSLVSLGGLGIFIITPLTSTSLLRAGGGHSLNCGYTLFLSCSLPYFGIIYIWFYCPNVPSSHVHIGGETPWSQVPRILDPPTRASHKEMNLDLPLLSQSRGHAFFNKLPCL